MIKRFNICTGRTYTSSSGEEKKAWLRVGTLTYFPATERYEAGYKLEMNMWPTTQFFVFEEKAQNEPRSDAEPRDVIDAETGRKTSPEAKQAAKQAPKSAIGNDADQIRYPTEEISPDDIPF